VENVYYVAQLVENVFSEQLVPLVKGVYGDLGLRVYGRAAVEAADYVSVRVVGVLVEQALNPLYLVSHSLQ